MGAIPISKMVGWIIILNKKVSESLKFKPKNNGSFSRWYNISFVPQTSVNPA